jgi:hypothetical protein
MTTQTRSGYLVHRNPTAAADGETADLGHGEGQGQSSQRTRQESIPSGAGPTPRDGDEDAEGHGQQREASRSIEEDGGMAAHPWEVEQSPADVCQSRSTREGEHEPQRRRLLRVTTPEREERRPERRPEHQDLDVLEAHHAGSDAIQIPRPANTAAMQRRDP